MVDNNEEKPLATVPEVVLKKRKSNEEWAIKRKAQLESRRKKRKDDSKPLIKKPEQFVKEFRDQELDLIRMKNRVKIWKSHQNFPESKLLFVIRLTGSSDMHPKTKKILSYLRLTRIFSGVFLKATQTTLDMLLRVEPYVAYGYPNLKSVNELVYKKGCGWFDRQNAPLTNNTVVEQALGKHGIICIEDIVHEIATIGPHFKEVTSFLMPFKLKKPEGGVLKKTKRPFKDGGDAGNRQDLINELINKMN